ARRPRAARAPRLRVARTRSMSMPAAGTRAVRRSTPAVLNAAMDHTLYPELVQLLAYTANVASAIRLHSAYNRGDLRYQQHAAVDVMWLSDSLHQFGTLAHALMAGKWWQAQLLTEQLIDVYEGYQRGAQGFVSDPSETFTRHSELVNLPFAI